MAEKPLTNRQRQAAETKTRIKDNAIALINEIGYENATISKICKAAGVSNGNFYHYFRSKEDLLLFTYSVFDEYLKDEFSKCRFNSKLDTIRALISEQMTGTKPGMEKRTAQVLQVQLGMSGGYVVERERYFHTYLHDLVRQAIDAGEIHPSHDAEDVSQRILRLSRGIIFDWAMRNGSYEAEAQARADLDLLFVALQLPAQQSEFTYSSRGVWQH